MTKRPDGSQANAIGGILIVIGIAAAFIASGAETFEGLVVALVVANLGIGLGIILLSLGYLVRAIWFLPGREIEADAPETLEAPDGGAFCDWCHLWVETPAKPCSKSDDDTIRADLEAASQGEGLAKACRLELIRKGYMEK